MSLTVQISHPDDVSEEIFYCRMILNFFPNASMEEMILFYKKYYPRMDAEAAAYMAGKLNLETKRPLRTFSKGMKRQAFLILALCAGTKYLLCDEVFDGLDPIVTEVMKNLFRQEMKERKFTVVVASHKLRELEDICHSIAILHKGGVLTSKDMRHQAGNICKYQCVFSEQTDLEEVKKGGRSYSFSCGWIFCDAYRSYAAGNNGPAEQFFACVYERSADDVRRDFYCRNGGKRV